VAQADPLVFDFSFNNTPSAYGGTAGTVTGQIFGLMDNASGQAATDIVILSSGGPGAFPIDLGTVGTTIYANSFSVANGQIVSAEFGQIFTENSYLNNALYLNLYGTYNLLQLPANYGNTGGFSGVTFTAETAGAVPEPASVLLFGGGLLALAWKQRSQGARNGGLRYAQPTVRS